MQMQPQQQQGQQAAMMPQPPQVISTKDSLYLTDMLSWNLMAVKKAHFFAAQCQDQEISQALEKCCQMHQRHYDKILQHLQNNQQSQMLQ
ncbi:hypothetical protein ACFOU2_25425 [Bacillus songklensis]|uniref:Spore coat protein n=1 Tax=Bacillus songklensis TaxID=1069116 RepID=A0ABV8BB11_9BACI